MLFSVTLKILLFFSVVDAVHILFAEKFVWMKINLWIECHLLIVGNDEKLKV